MTLMFMNNIRCPECGATINFNTVADVLDPYTQTPIAERGVCANGHTIVIDGKAYTDLKKQDKEEKDKYSKAMNIYCKVSTSKQNHICTLTDCICESSDCRKCNIPIVNAIANINRPSYSR